MTCGPKMSYNQTSLQCQCSKDYPFATASGCIQCYLPKYFNTSSLTCDSCPLNYIYSLDLSMCVACPAPTPVFNGTSCAPCPNNTYFEAGSCVGCSANRTYNNAKGVCECDASLFYNGSQCIGLIHFFKIIWTDIAKIRQGVLDIFKIEGRIELGFLAYFKCFFYRVETYFFISYYVFSFS